MTGKKIRVALCLSGEPRSSMFCFPYIYESLLQTNPYFEVDTYIHSWKFFRALPLYNPKSYELEQQNSIYLEPNLLNNFLQEPHLSGTINNHFKMYYSIKKCFDLIKQPYDIYIRCRLDLIFESKLILYPIFLDILENKYDMFSLHSDYPTKNKKGIDDQLIISNFKGTNSLSKYSPYHQKPPYINFKKLIKELGYFHPETLLKLYLDKQDIKVISNPLSNYRLVRNSQIQTDQPFNFLDQ